MVGRTFRLTFHHYVHRDLEGVCSMSNVAVAECIRCGVLANWELELHSEHCEVVRTIPGNVYNIKYESFTPRNPYRTGYGRKIPIRYMIKYESGKKYESNRWRRVYVMQYGNSGSAYIFIRNRIVFLDSVTESKLERLWYVA